MGADCVTSCGDTVFPAHVTVLFIFIGLIIVTRAIAWAAERRRTRAVDAILDGSDARNESA